MRASQSERYMRPIANLAEYVKNRAIRDRAGWVDNQWYLDGRYYTEEEFNLMFPCEIKYEGVQVDGRSIPK